MKVDALYYMLMVVDMDRAVGFYRDVVGLKVRSQSDAWSELVFGDALLGLHGGGSGALKETGLGLQVADLEAACGDVSKGGGSVVKEPSDRPGEPIRLAQVSDTEGNILSLTQYVG